MTPSDINDRGQVVGRLSTQDYWNSATRGFVWKRGSLNLLSHRGTWAGAKAINERGQILGTDGDQEVLWENRQAKSLGLDAAWELNEAGQVLGGNQLGNDTDGYSTVPALWTNGKVQLLPFDGKYPTAMNNKGQVVGQLPNGDAAEWQDGEVTDLGAGTPMAINDEGDILGSLGQDVFWRNDVVTWRHGTRTDIGEGSPIALNEHGEAIVLGVGGLSFRAYLWRNDTMTDIGTLGGDWSVPTAISDSGQVIGSSADSRGGQHGFVWQNGVMTRLPSPPGYGRARTRAIGINDHNQIIGDNCISLCGEVRTGPGSRNRFAVLWTLRGDQVKTRLIPSRHDSRRQLGARTAITAPSGGEATPRNANALGRGSTKQRVRIEVKGTDPFSFELKPSAHGRVQPDSGEAEFCCWSTWSVTRAGAKLDVSNPLMTLHGERGTLKLRERIEWVPLPDGWSVCTGTWKVTGGERAYAETSGHGRVACSWGPESDPKRALRIRLFGFLGPG